jgi:hypothetical protein
VVATDAIWTLDAQSLIIADREGRIVIYGQGEHEVGPLRVETMPRNIIHYEQHLHAFVTGTKTGQPVELATMDCSPTEPEFIAMTRGEIMNENRQ